MAQAQLPSTTALRAFLAVAASGSTAQAAAAVNLTQSAVSKQVASLERSLGVTLFERTARGLRLTEAGEIYRPYATAALEQLEIGVRRLDERAAATRPIRLHILPILGERWLVPRFPDFAAAHPDIDVQFTSYVSQDAAEPPDARFLHGLGDWPGEVAHYLFGREIALVSTPALAERAGGLAAPQVQRATLLQHFQTPAYWAEFTEAHGLRGAVPAHTVRYGFMSVVIRAALAGLGIALVPRCLVEDELADGRLVNPGGLGFTSAHGYWLALPRDRPPSPALTALTDWLLREAAAIRARETSGALA